MNILFLSFDCREHAAQKTIYGAENVSADTIVSSACINIFQQLVAAYIRLATKFAKPSQNEQSWLVLLSLSSINNTIQKISLKKKNVLCNNSQTRTAHGRV